MFSKRRREKAGGELPRPLEQERLQLERALGKRVVVKAVKRENPRFRGRVRHTPRQIVIEYQISQPGYFWEAGLMEKLFLLALKREGDFTLSED